MNLRLVVIGMVFVGVLILFLLAYHAVFIEGATIREDNLTLRYCTGDRFAFIQGTYQDPVTEEEIAREKEAVILRVRTADGTGPRAGGSGGGGPGEPRIVAWGYCIDRNGVSSGFNYGMGNDAPCRDALERSDAWFREEVVNRSLDDNATCTSRTVVETFRRTGSELVRVT